MRKLKMLIVMLGAAIPFVLAQPAAAADKSGWRLLVDSNGNVGVNYYAHSGGKYGRASYGAYGPNHGKGRPGPGYRGHGPGYDPYYQNRRSHKRGFRRGYDRGYDRGYNQGYRNSHDYGGYGYSNDRRGGYKKGRGGYSSGYGGKKGHGYQSHRPRCEGVFKRGRWHGRPAKVGGTRCFDRYGNGYIVQGSRYLIHYY